MATPRSSAAFTSIEALGRAVEAIRRSFGRRSMTLRVIGRMMIIEHGNVRPRIVHRPVGHREGEILIVVQNSYLETLFHHVPLSSLVASSARRQSAPHSLDAGRLCSSVR